MLTIRSTPSTHALPPEPRAWPTVAHDTGDVARRRRTRRRTPSASALLRTCASQTLLQATKSRPSIRSEARQQIGIQRAPDGSACAHVLCGQACAAEQLEARTLRSQLAPRLGPKSMPETPKRGMLIRVTLQSTTASAHEIAVPIRAGVNAPHKTMPRAAYSTYTVRVC